MNFRQKVVFHIQIRLKPKIFTISCVEKVDHVLKMYVFKSKYSAQNGYRSECPAPAADVAQWLESTVARRKVGGSNPASPKSFTLVLKASVTSESMALGTDYPSVNTNRSSINNSYLKPIFVKTPQLRFWLHA